MKKKFLLLGFLLVFLFGSLAVYGQDAVYLSTAKDKKYKDTLPELKIYNFKESGVRIMYSYKGTVLAPTYADGDNYYIPHIYGYAHMRDVGLPMLPAKNHHIAVPAGAAVGIHIEDVQFEEHAVDRMVQPAQEPLPDCEGCPEPPFEINRDVYETDADFPTDVVKILGCETYRGIPVAVIQVRPVQFNPVTKTMKVYSKIKFKVTFSGEGCSFSPFGHKNSKHANDMVRSAVLNRDSIPGGLASAGTSDQVMASEVRESGAKDYIMIVHSNYLAAAQDLATWKRQMGYSVEIVSQSSWTTTQVKNELQTRYDSWTPKPSFFLLFGDHGDIPAEYTSRYTDLYYAEMEGSGYKPEMAYGRIFPSSSTDAQVIVDKIINYEKNPPTLSSFYTNALACAYFQDDEQDGYATRRFAHTSEDIRNHVMGQGYAVNRVYVTGSTIDPQYYNNGYFSPPNTPIPSELRKPGFPWDGDATDIINYIDAGRFLVWHRDHGGETLWGDPYFTTTHIGQLNNGSLLPIVMSVNCLTGKFTYSSECFCERFLRRSGGGCVGIFGATEVSYSGPNDGYAPGIIDAIWPDPQIDPQYGSGGAGDPIPAHGPIYTMGDILNHSKVAMEYLWGIHQTTWELHHYFGDPAMQIWTAEPTAAAATHPSSLGAGATSLDITASNCPGGTAALLYEGILYGKTTLAGDGTGTITFSPLSGVDPNSVLTISKHNFKPYIANIAVSGGLPPDANFESDKTNLMATDTVQFTDTSTMSPSAWEWTFEGGTPATSTEQNPLITYNTAGTFTVTLIASNINGSDTETKVDYITVTPLQPPVADFIASDTTIEEGDTITFTDQTTNFPTSWTWSFPGGTPSGSTAQNPTVTYNTAGTYDVTLTASNGAGSDNEIKVGYITVTVVLPTVGSTTVFGTTSVTPNRRAMPYTMPEDGTIQNVTIYHEGGSGGLILGVYDGATLPANRLGVTVSTPINASAGWQTIDLTTPAFVSGGTTVWLAWVFETIPGIRYQTGTPGRAQSADLWEGGMPDPFGTSTLGDFLYSIYASYMPSGGQPPVANFTADKTTVDEGDSVNFTDQSTYNPDTWDWTFNGGTPATSTAQNPTVTYSTAGTYTVTLVASNSYGSDTETKVDYITVQVPNQPPTADFTFTTTDLTADFTDTSTDSDGTIVGWDWDFGDGNTSTAQNPSHTYAAAGTYTVTLTVTDDDSATDSVSKPVTVTEPANVPPTADFTFTTTDLTANFTDTSTDSDGTIVSWLWNFGDGNTSTVQNPGHTYASAGTYTVTLTVTDDDSATDSVSKPVTVTAGNQPPTADFTFTTNGLTANFTDTSTDSDGTIVSWLWNFGDGNTSTVQNPGHTYAAAGTYTVTLTVTDDDSATDTTSKPVTVTGPVVEIYVYDITQTIKKMGRNYESDAAVTIRDTNNNPVADATVSVTWSGVVSGSYSGVTAADGTVTFKSDKVKSTGPFTITVNNVTHATLTYNPTLNIETSDTAYY